MRVSSPDISHIESLVIGYQTYYMGTIQVCKTEVKGLVSQKSAVLCPWGSVKQKFDGRIRLPYRQIISPPAICDPSHLSLLALLTRL